MMQSKRAHIMLSERPLLRSFKFRPWRHLDPGDGKLAELKRASGLLKPTVARDKTLRQKHTTNRERVWVCSPSVLSGLVLLLMIFWVSFGTSHRIARTTRALRSGRERNAAPGQRRRRRRRGGRRKGENEKLGILQSLQA